MTVPLPVSGDGGRWRSPISGKDFGRLPVLLASEQRAARELGLRNLRRQRGYDRAAVQWTAIRRLLAPLETVTSSLDVPAGSWHLTRAMNDAVAVLLLRCAERGRSYWGWTAQEWLDLLDQDHAAFQQAVPQWAEGSVRPFLCAHAYHLGEFRDFHRLGSFNRLNLAGRIFGKALVTCELDRVRSVLTRWGYRYGQDHDKTIPAATSQILLLNRSPHLEDLTTEVFTRAREESLNTEDGLRGLHPLQRAVAALGYCDPPNTVPSTRGLGKATGVPEPWAKWVQRWFDTSTLARSVRRHHRTILHKTGRWHAAEHPRHVDPTAWTRQTCASWVAAVDRMHVGDYVVRAVSSGHGQPLRPRSKDAHLSALRAFFRDCQEWEWAPRRFDVQRSLGTPPAVRALLGQDPRVIEDDLWAKLLWAGLNLDADDLFQTSSGTFYPLELVRAITVTWLFSGLRSDEIARLRVGCVRWQHDGTGIAADSQQVLARDAVYLLDVPPHKTGSAFTKPVDPILGQAIEAWQALRPEQPKRTDRRTGEQVDNLFSLRARAVPPSYINASIIPMLCRKAGVPATDVRGNITSHRARSTIAS
ncbi:site-specific integrase [Streptomyces sp. NPDC094472]|uniref:site-specific integrase n=1 Tax=Streptomyces sp. NPDC094472 TaxID=3155080 RepID=UPI00331882D1